MAWRIFIDTNILLDFYRVKGMDASMPLLDRIDNHHDDLVTSEQVEMEYKKNRQVVIVESMREHKLPNWNTLQVPVFLRSAKPARMLAKAQDHVREHSTKLIARMERVLKDPTHYDPVYKVLQRLFKSRKPTHLSREKKIRLAIRYRAQKRFRMGYPPRKPSDVSMGDAINWEWIVEVARTTGNDIVIVSRDSDYGTVWDKKPQLNDWLRQEFAERISRKRKIQLSNLLSHAYKQASIPVTREEEKKEEALVELRKSEVATEIATEPAERQEKRVWDIVRMMMEQARIGRPDRPGGQEEGGV